MKKFILKTIVLYLFLFLGGIGQTYGQAVEENEEVRTFLDGMFQHLEKAKVPYGLLRDYAFELTEMERFSGSQLTDDNYVDRQTYEMLLRTIRSSAVGTKPFGDVTEILAKQYGGGNENTVAISAMAYQYSYIKANVLEDGLIRYENGKVYDNYKNGVWQNPYENEYVIGFCGQDSIFTTSSLSFKLNENCWFSNLAWNKIELDAGTGYKSISPGGYISISYTTDGVKEIKLRVTLTNGKQLTSHTSIRIDDPLLTKAYEDEELIKPREVKEGDAYRGIKTKAQIFVKCANPDGNIRNPFIVVEGFDPRFMDKSKKFGQSNMENFYNHLYNNRSECAKLLQNYDIIYVDWVNSEEYIQANASTLQKVIEWVNMEKRSSRSTSPNVIMGQSMGGLIVRYALKSMENANITHETSLYISDDAPHLGANVPLGALYALHGMGAFFENKPVIDFFTNLMFDSRTLLGIVMKAAHCNAAKQMLVNYVDFGGNINNTAHTLWQQELANLGFPQGDNNSSFRMLSIANGCYSPNLLPSSFLKANFSASSDLIGILPAVTGTASPIIALLLNDIWTGLLSILPGKTTIKGAFEINPGTSIGEKVTHIKLYYVKKFMWVADMRRTVFLYEGYMQGLTYDIFPSSIINLQEESSRLNPNPDPLGIPVVGILHYHIDMATSIPFIPTSSALCAGFGTQALTSSLFTTKPSAQNTPFGENVFIHEGYSTIHTSLSSTVCEWLVAQLDFGIVGPKHGVSGSKYVVPNTSNVQWSTDNSNIATIDQNGVLQVRGNGIVNVKASKGSMISASMEVMVGTPQFVLEDVVRIPGYYSVKSKCINADYADFLQRYKNVIIYQWGVKTGNEDIKWFKSDSPELLVSTLEDNENTTIYLKILDMHGNESNPLFVRISGYDIYNLGYKTLVFNREGEVFDVNGRTIFYDYATMPLTYQEGAYEDFSNAEWNPLGAVVINDENVPRGIPWKRYGYIRDIISLSERERILSSSDGKVMIYKLLLLNFDGRIIQKTPFTVMYKANFPN